MRNVLSVKNLSVGYKNAIVNDVSFDVSTGEIIGILGLNGSGKSTLLAGLCGINKIFSGDIFVSGIKINTLSSKKRARYISYFTQRTPAVEGLTVKQIIELGCYSKSSDFFLILNQRENNETVRYCANLFNITHLLDTDITKLSEGQRSLAFLAKIFAQDTPIILLDEPDNNLDYLNTHNLFSTFKNQVENKNKTAIVVLHNPALALNYCSKLIVISGGEILGEASTKDGNTAKTQSLLRCIYPDIIIKKDSGTNMFYTVFEKFE